MTKTPDRVSRFAAIDAALSETTRRGSCYMCAWLEDQPPEDAEYIRSLLEAPVKAKGHMHISQVLAKGGFEISEDAVRNHRTNHVYR